MPAARLSAIRRSSSWNMYGGIASRRFDGVCDSHGRGNLLTQLGQCRDELRRELAGADRLGPAGQAHVQVLGDLDLELAAVELDRDRALGTPRRKRSPRRRWRRCRRRASPPRLARRSAPARGCRRSAGRRRWCGWGRARWPSISGPIAPRSSCSSSSPTTIAHCGLPIETCWNSHSRPACAEDAAAVGLALGEVLRRGRRPAHVDRAGALRGDRRRDRPGHRGDREDVLVGPAVPPQVEDRLARPVAGELGLGAVGVEDPQRSDELGIVTARQQQHPVGADAEVRVADPLHPRLGQLPGQRLGLEIDVVIPQRRPLLESHEPSLVMISAATSASPSSLRSIVVRLGILRIQVSWRRA